MSGLSIGSNRVNEPKENTNVAKPDKLNITEKSSPEIKNDSVKINTKFQANPAIPNLGFGIISPEGWGSHSQIGGTYKDLQDVKGNKDGIWDNEKDKSGTVNACAPTVPGKSIVAKINSSLSVGVSLNDEVKELAKFRATKETEWGQPVTSLDLSKLKDGDLFAVQKSIALTRIDRKPSDVTDAFVSAKGSVNGIKIADREVFIQRFKPIGQPSGKVVVVSPGFQETGRNFYDQIQELNKQGHDVVVMDHQWAGQTKGGEAGGLDRGFGVARDVASVAAYAQKEVLEKEYGKVAGHELVLFGNSMGAGPGVLGALTMNDSGKIQLEGAQMPKGINAVLQAPFLKTSPGFLNTGINALSKVPLANKMELPSSGLPILTHDKATAQKGAEGAILEDVRAQLKTMSGANEDIKVITDMIKDGHGPKGHISIIHGNKDPLADPEQSKLLAKQLGGNVTLNIVNSNNHVLEQNPAENGIAVDALNTLVEKH